MQDVYAIIEETAAAFIASVGADDHDTYLASGFEAKYGPLQQEIPGDTSIDHLENLAYKDYFKPELDRFTIDSDKRLIDSTIDSKKRKAWLWYQLELKNAGELLDSSFEKIVMEVMWLLDFTEDGKQVTRCRQYLDTVGYDAFFPAQADAAQASFPEAEENHHGAAHDHVAALTSVDEDDGVEDFLKGLAVSQS